MKTLRLVAMIMALTALPVEGQLEFSGGMNLSDLKGALGGSDIQGATNRAGMFFGIDLIIPTGGPGLGLGAGWSQKGVEQLRTDPATQQEIARLIDLELSKCRSMSVYRWCPPDLPRSTSCSARLSGSRSAVTSLRASTWPKSVPVWSMIDRTSRRPISAAQPALVSVSAWAGSYTPDSTCAIRPG